jgi:Leucine-rich repeat (LRR) protein/GTPase SAR1 family protein
MPTPTDRERLAHFIQLIGAKPRQAEFDEAGNLIKLNLAGLGLRELPPDIGWFVNLKSLVLGEVVWIESQRTELGNQLTMLPATIGALTNLYELKASCNQLQNLPEELSQLVHLQTLTLDNNQLHELPAWLAKLQALWFLDLHDNQLSNLPLDFAKLVNLRSLHLFNNQLSSLPPDFTKLVNLQTLHLSHNQIGSLPPDFAKLVNLQRLWLQDNELSCLPPSFVQIVNLRMLFLGNNKLCNLPPNFTQLVNLQRLELSDNQLCDLPSDFTQLINLQYLWLNNSQLSSLPHDFTNLINLIRLDITNNQLSSLPSDFAKLVNLQELWLGKNQLSNLPSDFAKLVNLQKLALHTNQLNVLPPDFAKLVNLQELYLAGNQLSSLPSDFAHFINLKKLRLHNNQLSSLPPDFAKLVNLQELNLSHNQLNNLPLNFTQLVNLKELRLVGNPWRTPPPEIAEAGIDEVMNFLQSLQTGNITIRYQAKLLIIGEGGSGKSSVLRALRRLTFDENLETTHGIDIQPYQLPHPNNADVTMTLNIWDFGGQQIYHTTHQFFMTRRSLYLLVWNARGDTEQGRLDHWLRNIRVLAPDAPVLLVATHIDERPADFNYDRFKASYPQLVGWVGVSNKVGTGIDQLSQIIAEQAAALPLMEQQWPGSWVAVEEALQKHSGEHITEREFHEICVANGITRPGEEKTLAGYLHDLGKILYFQEDDALSDFVVLKPNWLTQTMARVLDDDRTRNRQGVLDHRDFSRLWPVTDPQMKYERRLYPLFHRMLERFLICYQLEDHPDGHAQSIVPLLLPHAPPTDLLSWDQVLAGQPEIRLCFKLDFVPPGLMSWFIVLSHHYSQSVHWREGVRLHYENHQAEVVLNPSVRELWLRLRGPAPSNFFNLLQHTINERIIKRYFTGLRYTREIPCNCAECQSAVATPHFFDYDKLVKRMADKRLQIECQRSYDMVSVPALLEGIHYTTQDRVEAKVDAALGEIRTLVMQRRVISTSGGSIVHGSVHSSVFVGRDQINLYPVNQEPIITRLDALGEGQARIWAEVVQSRQLSEQILRDTTRLWNLSTNNLSADAPSAFLLMPGDRSRFHLRNLFDSDFTLYLLCQHPAAPHLPKGEAGYSLPANRQWWSAVAPWLAELIKYLKYLPHASGIAKAYDETFYKQIELTVELFKTAIELAPILDDDEDRPDISRTGELGSAFEVQGAALRALHTFLQEVDPKRHWCGLRKVATNDGNLLWLCPEHARFHGI